MYSQNDEEKVILDFFGDSFGAFYDIGAWDGKTFSNVRALLERGWSGIMVEPSPAAFVELLANTEEFRDKVTLVNAAVTREPVLAKFYDAGGDAVGSLSKAHSDKWEQFRKKPMREFVIHTLSAVQLFSTFGEAEFISLDVEGTNVQLFPQLPWHWKRLRAVCVEHDGYELQMSAMVEPLGFRQIYRSGENIILVRV